VNADRRIACMALIELSGAIVEAESVSNETHEKIGEALKALKQQEYWALRNIKPDRNDSSARQHAIATIALTSLEEAATAHADMDYVALIERLEIAMTTNGTATLPVKEESKKGLRKLRK
jgi:hypothetical protein